MKTVHKVALAALLWLIVINPGTLNFDTTNRLAMAHAWWTGTEETLNASLAVNVQGKNYVPYDLGQSMLMLPADWLGTQLGKSLPSEQLQTKLREAVVSFLVFTPINLAAVLGCFWLLKLFKFGERLSAVSSLTWLLGTTVLQYSATHQQNNQILLFVVLSYAAALAYVLKGNAKFAIFSGLASGMAFFIRITSLLHFANVVFFLVGCVAYQQRSLLAVVRSLKFWLIGFLPIFLLERGLNYLRYGSFFATSASLHLQIYRDAETVSDSPSVAIPPPAEAVITQGDPNDFSFLDLLAKQDLDSFLGPLFSPEKSVFVYDMLLLPGLILAVIYWKRLLPFIRWYIVVVVLDFCLHLFLYGWNQDTWHGDSAWAARYHVTSIHLLLIPLIPLLVRLVAARKVFIAWLTRSLIGFAIICQLASVSLLYDLEIDQQLQGIGSRFRLAQRWHNIVYLIPTPLNPTDANHPSLGNTISNEWKSWRFVPFIYQQNLPPDSSLAKLAPMLYIVWGILTGLAIAITLWLMRQLPAI
jgi:hypothetical protein